MDINKWLGIVCVHNFLYIISQFDFKSLLSQRQVWDEWTKGEDASLLRSKIYSIRYSLRHWMYKSNSQIL